MVNYGRICIYCKHQANFHLQTRKKIISEGREDSVQPYVRSLVLFNLLFNLLLVFMIFFAY